MVMFGGLHIEMAALKTIGDWLRGSGWVQVLVQADLALPGIADSFYKQHMFFAQGEFIKSPPLHCTF